MAKYCPHCGDFFLYDDSQTSCPDCNRPLVPYQQTSAPPQFRDTAAQAETREAPAQPGPSSSKGTAGGAGGFSQFAAGDAPPDRSRPNSGQQQERTWNRAAPQQPQLLQAGRVPPKGKDPYTQGGHIGPPCSWGEREVKPGRRTFSSCGSVPPR